MTSTTRTPKSGGCIVLLDVPPNSSITLDGITRVTPSVQSQSQGFNRGLFIVDNIPSNIQFHLLVVRAGRESTNQNDGGSLPVGFVLVSPAKPDKDSMNGYDWTFARKYDRQTEEISNALLDKATERNLMNAITEENGELRKYAMSYEQFMGLDGTNIESWRARTTLIDGSFLSKQHELTHGDKIVPSSDTSRQVDTEMEVESMMIDGKSVHYPNIPCIDPEMSARQLTRHEGTKAYISRLDPNLRTWVLSGGVCGFASNKEYSCPEEYIWNNVLNEYYGKSGKREDHFLADIQLSFLLFLFMECQSSLEHWRDAVSMASLTIKPSTRMMDNKFGLVQEPIVILQLLYTLHAQLSCIEAEFFHETEYSSGESNFLIGAMKRVCATCATLEDKPDILSKIKEYSLKLQKLLSSRFHVNLSQLRDQEMIMDGGMDIVTDPQATECTTENTNHEGSYDEDAPVIVPSHEVEASLSRSSIECLHNKKYQTMSGDHNRQHRLEYPLLFAAIAPHEDVVMACARILDIGNDVSLVREAAAYLEEVEAHRR